jgi:hypothetical protein
MFLVSSFFLLGPKVGTNFRIKNLQFSIFPFGVTQSNKIHAKEGIHVKTIPFEVKRDFFFWLLVLFSHGGVVFTYLKVVVK